MKDELAYEPPMLTPAGDFGENTLGTAVGWVLDGGAWPYHVYFGRPGYPQ